MDALGSNQTQINDSSQNVWCHLPTWQLPVRVHLQTRLLFGNSSLLLFGLFSFNNFSLNLRTSIAPNRLRNTSLNTTQALRHAQIDTLRIRSKLDSLNLTVQTLFFILFYYLSFSLFSTACFWMKCFQLLFSSTSFFLLVAMINLKC